MAALWKPVCKLFVNVGRRVRTEFGIVLFFLNVLLQTLWIFFEQRIMFNYFPVSPLNRLWLKREKIPKKGKAENHLPLLPLHVYRSKSSNPIKNADRKREFEKHTFPLFRSTPCTRVEMYKMFETHSCCPLSLSPFWIETSRTCISISNTQLWLCGLQ